MKKLLPFSYSEIAEPGIINYEFYLYNGFYPRIYDMKIQPEDFYPSYIQAYIERDVRMVRNIGDLGKFQLFLKLCAGRIGQLLNFSSLANECEISHTTVSAWISILEASYIIFLLKPHHKNFNKRLVKMPKLYFYDTGLASYLLGIRSIKQISTHYSRGALFESFIISEFFKGQYNIGREPDFYFWRDKTGNEVDVIVENGEDLIPIEIKSGRTITKDYFKGLNYWSKISGSTSKGIVIFGGNTLQQREKIDLLPWNELDKMNF